LLARVCDWIAVVDNALYADFERSFPTHFEERRASSEGYLNTCSIM
jgi:hypothetical protein